ncbi:ABC transporter permease [Nostoc sp.]|uniref:ABC transporter permease n=1 Tax=Nostoc sp. TaxID=1180 RepID=UPI002FF9D25C
MFNSSLDRKLWRDLLGLRGQVLAIALIVACGISSLIMIQSTHASLALTKSIYYDSYRFAHVFAQMKRAPETLASQIAEIPGVAQTQTRIVVDVTLDIPNFDEPVIGRLISIPQERVPILNDLYIRKGRYIESDRGDEVLVSEAFAEAHQLDLGDSIGAVINSRWQQLRIVGIALSPEYVYEVRGEGSLFPDHKRFGVIWMGRKALATAFDLDDAFNNVTLRLMPRVFEEDVIERLDQLLERYGSLGAYGRKNQLSNKVFSNDVDQLKVSGTMMPCLFLAIAAFLLNFVISRLVGTQREQIAVLKALGYGNIAIGGHYLKLVLSIVSWGTVIGIVGGFWLGSGYTHVYTEIFRLPILHYEARTDLAIAVICISVGAACLGGFGSVRKAISLPPAEAMRPEPPAKFRPSIIERLSIGRFLSPTGRIICRNLERKSVQAGFSILGIAIAIALLVVGRYFEDALAYLIDFQFNIVQRQDITIIFNEPRPNRVRYEITHFPGVLSAEPFRTVPVNLMFEHHKRQGMAITGIDPAGRLQHLVDRNLYPVNLPTDGVVLTTKLAQILGVIPGEKLTVEVLEGSHAVHQVAVMGLVDELMGFNVYMDIYALNRLMEEGQTVSGVYAAIDLNASSQLYSYLKKIPDVTNVFLRKASIESFQESMGKNMQVATKVLLVFATIITVSVVYNGAQISLSERQRELASLRIIGFTRAEIAFILLGEQGIITLVAIPLGLVLGSGLAALMSVGYDSELYRLPLIVTKANYTFAIMVVIAAAISCGLIVQRQLNRLDLIAVLKTRE